MKLITASLAQYCHSRKMLVKLITASQAQYGDVSETYNSKSGTVLSFKEMLVKLITASLAQYCHSRRC